MTGRNRARTLAAIARKVSAGDGTSGADALTHMSQLIGEGYVGREDFDDAVTSFLGSVGADPKGVRSWLSDVGDEEIAEAFAEPTRRRLRKRDVVALGGWTEGLPSGEVSAIAATLCGIPVADKPAIIAASDPDAIGRALVENPRTTVICRDPSEQAAIAIWLHLEGIGTDADTFALGADRGGYDRLLCLDPTDDALVLADRLLAPGGEAVLAVDRNGLSGRAGREEREAAVRSGMLDSSLDCSRFEGIWRLVRGRKPDAPVYLAKCWGRGAQESFGDATCTSVAADMSSAVLRHEQINYFGMDVPVETILDHPRVSLRLDDYAPTVPPPASGSYEESMSDALSWCEDHCDDGGEIRLRVVETCRRALKAIESLRS